MAKSRPSVQKRLHETNKAEKRTAKALRKAERDQASEGKERPDGVDPDIAGIVPGPQPVREDY